MSQAAVTKYTGPAKKVGLPDQVRPSCKFDLGKIVGLSALRLLDGPTERQLVVCLKFSSCDTAKRSSASRHSSCRCSLMSARSAAIDLQSIRGA